MKYYSLYLFSLFLLTKCSYSLSRHYVCFQSTGGMDGESSLDSSYDQFDPSAAEGFIHLWGLSACTQAQAQSYYTKKNSDTE